MVGHDHAPSQKSEERSPAVQARHARLGMRLFAIYFVLYATFMGLVAFDRERLKISVASGINLALVYGLGLIAAAIVLAFFYGWLCRRGNPTDSDEAPH